MRAVAAQREVDMWENLLEELKGGGIGNVPLSYVEEEDVSFLTMSWTTYLI